MGRLTRHSGERPGDRAMKYSYFNTKSEAEAFLASARAQGKLGYYLGVTCGQHEIRTWGDWA